MEYTLYTKAEIAAMIEDGIPEDTSIYCFNPKNPATGGRIYMLPINNVTFGSIVSDDACFVGVRVTDVAPAPDPGE